MTETVQVRGSAPVELQPCPPWCVMSEHFGAGLVADADDGFHHFGPEAAGPTFDRLGPHDPGIVVKVLVKAWTCPLDAKAGPGRVELQVTQGSVASEDTAELTPGQARAVAQALQELADVAERGDAY